MERIARLLLPVLLLAGLLPLGAATAAAAAAVPSGSLAKGQSLFVPVEPVRLMDTRTGRGVPVGPDGVHDLRVVDGVRVPADATAVVLNVTATAPTARATDVRVYPTPSAGGGYPTVSNLNLTAGATVANLVTVKIGARGQVRLRNETGTVHLIADLAGFYTGSGRGSSLVAGSPTRLLDTRLTGGPLGAGEVRRLRVAGVAGVPAGTTAVVLNVTGVFPTAQTDVRVWPTRAGAAPHVSNLNPRPGLITAASVVVPVGADGTVSLRNAAGHVHLVVDLLGRYTSGASASVFAPVAPHRLLDTRTTGGALGRGAVRDVVVAGNGVVPAPGTAVVLNVTAVGGTAVTDVRVYPTPRDGRVPGTSNLNAVRGQTVANAVLATVGRDGRVRLFNANGAVHLVVDLAGWYGPSGEGWDISWPQCTSAGSTSSRLPVGGAFAVVGLTRGRPLTPNECFRAQWQWAQTLPGEPAVYLNLNAPGPRTTPDGQRWVQLCGTGRATSSCGGAYGVEVARYALARLPVVSRHGGRPMVWMDVEGPYPGGPFWQTGYAGAVAVNRAVLEGAVDTLRGAGYRVGIYTDRGSSPANDWVAIMGSGYRLLQTQNWVFRAPTSDGHALCAPAHSGTGGPVVMVQIQPGQSGEAYDVNHLC